MPRYVPSREASKILGLHANTLRKYADEGRISTYRTASGQRRFDVDSYLGATVETTPTVVCYCRASSPAQKPDLERQVQSMRERFPEADIVQDIGSALNDQRQGLQSVLGRVLRGEKLTVVVAHKDRLARVGCDLIEWIIRDCGSELVVLSDHQREPERELAEDLLAILHGFAGGQDRRTDHTGEAHPNATHALAREAAERLDRHLSVRLQRDDLAAESSDRPPELHGDQEVPDPPSS
ncbi:IS607 family transposase [Halochromatium salexigens]|uniref:IS607 family transposase n=1 Tax=Halochromatium salexigens TaxID=49447 RepID=A0AAJ0UG83_HALSE|nr:IS607 family transposase [Halochromatium salexigens]